MRNYGAACMQNAFHIYNNKGQLGVYQQIKPFCCRLPWGYSYRLILIKAQYAQSTNTLPGRVVKHSSQIWLVVSMLPWDKWKGSITPRQQATISMLNTIHWQIAVTIKKQPEASDGDLKCNPNIPMHFSTFIVERSVKCCNNLWSKKG